MYNYQIVLLIFLRTFYFYDFDLRGHLGGRIGGQIGHQKYECVCVYSELKLCVHV